MSDKLVLQATIDENIIAKLNEIESKLNGLRVTPGMKATGGWFSDLSKQSHNLTQEGLKALDVIGGFGVAGLAGGAGIAVMTSKMKEFAATKTELSQLARQMEIGVDVLNRWQKAGEHFAGVTGDKMTAMMESLNKQLWDFQNRPAMSELFKNLASRGFGDLMVQLKKDGGDLEKSIMDIFRKVEQISGNDPRKKKQLLEQFFPGAGDTAERLLSQGGVKGFIDQLQKMNKDVNPISPELLKSQQAFTDSLRDFNVQLENFENKAAPDLLKSMTAIVKTIIDFYKTIDDKNNKPIDKDSTPGEIAGDAWKASNDWTKRNLPPWLRDPLPFLKLPGEDPTPAEQPKSDIPVRGLRQGLHKTAFNGEGGLLKFASYSDSSSSGAGSSPLDAQGMIEMGTMRGVLAAFRQWETEARPGRGGLLNTSLETGDALGGSGAGAGGGGGSGGGGGGGGGGKPFSGNAGVGGWWTKENISHGIDRLMKEAHLTRAGAEGLVSRWATVEAPGGPTSVNPKSGAVGIIQALGNRKAGFGPGTSYDDQLTAAIHQLNTSEKKAGDFLRHAQTAHDGAVGGSMFERAEGYNPTTGTDNWTSKSEAGNQHVGIILRGGSLNPGGELTPGGGTMGQAVDHAAKLLGMGSSEAARALGAKMTPGEWCADFVGGVLHSSGIKGTNSSLASSFLHWGTAVASTMIKKGDILVRTNGHHVGIAEGPARMHNGRMMVPMISGNYGHKVSESWENPDAMYARRATGLEPKNKTAKGGSPGDATGHAHVKIEVNHDGVVKRSHVKSSGMVTASIDNMRRFPTMKTPQDA